MKLNRKKHQVGDKRERLRFAWLPVTLDNGDRIWLEFYYLIQEYTLTRQYRNYNPYDLTKVNRYIWKTIEKVGTELFM